uniref:50S ribosomal protein L4 n=1 Tax=Nephromyces sp. ex Molgula occidentalis TaxID=2544991 RepID=A0A5C1H857_9APIC|nr:50S ribosomal protein L4 [Nephromyces sp. ex Molgula occidentalis]
MIIKQKKFFLFYPIRTFIDWRYFNFELFILKLNININYLKLNLYYINKLITKLIKLEIFFINSKNKISSKIKSEINKSNRKLRPQKGTGKSRIKNLNISASKNGSVCFGPRSKIILKKFELKNYNLLKQLILFNKRSHIIIINYKNIFNLNKINLENHINNQLKNFGIKKNNSNILFLTLIKIKLNIHYQNFKIKTFSNIFLIDLLLSDYIVIFL